ncbi:MAG: hypothetical protein PSV46_27975 [Reyranella sp.]|nr:hypothetical protein [Reyranella sp.]
MSMDLHVCWRGDLAWDRARLKSALDALGFDATVLYDFEGAEAYWPIEIAGCKTGVEIYFDDNLEELTGLYPELAAAVDGRDKVVNFTWGADAAEGGTALALAAALTSLGDAIIYFPQDAICMTKAEAADEARKMFELAKTEGYRAHDE